MCAGKMFWGCLVEYRLAMSLVQGTNGQGEMCTEGSKVTALRVLMLLRHAMVEREDVIFCDPRWGPVLDACTGSWLHQSEIGRCYLQI